MWEALCVDMWWHGLELSCTACGMDVCDAGPPSEQHHARYSSSGSQGKLYQWANALTTNSNNLPLALPLRVDGIDGGFQVHTHQHVSEVFPDPCMCISI